MSKLKYSMELKEDMARAHGVSLPISTKVAVEMANFLRGRTTKKALAILEEVLEKKTAIPFKRFTDGVGHRPGKVGPGRYPQKASQEFIKLIKQVEANAEAKTLGDNLVIVHLSANKASKPMRQGRQRRRQFKRTHVQIIVQEQEEKKETKQTKGAKK